MKKSLLSLLVGLLFIPPSVSLAENMVYDGTDPGMLRPETISITPGLQSLYPDAISGNTVTVTGGSPSSVFGGLSASGQISVNTVNFNGGSAQNVYGGYSNDGLVSGNAVNVGGGSAVYVYGGYSVNADATGNILNMDGGSASEIYGGYSIRGYASGNTVNFNGGSSTIVYGGHSNFGTVSGNLVNVDGGFAYRVYGGFNAYADATGNIVNINNSKVRTVSAGASMTGNVSGNTVNFNGGSASEIYGGYSDNGNATGNRVNLGGTIDNTDTTDPVNTYGGYSMTGSASGNTVNASGVRGSDSTLSNKFDIYAGYSTDGDTNNNIINITDSHLGYVHGGYTTQGNASGNTVHLNSGSATQIYGGRTTDGDANGNTVNVYGGTTLQIVGGQSGDGNATGNTVTIDGMDAGTNINIYGASTITGDASGNVININGGNFEGAVFGGNSSQGKAINNTINLNGGVMTGDVMGGLSSAGNDFTGNTLNVKSRYSLVGAHNFQYLNFTLPADFQPNGNDVMLATLNSNLSFRNKPTEVSTISSINVSPGNKHIKPGDTVTLVTASTLPIGGSLTSDKAQGTQGISLLYDWDEVKITNTPDSGSLTAHLAAVSVNPQSRTLLYGRASELALLKQGGDLLAGRATENMVASAKRGDTGFFAMQGGESHYKTGPDFHLDSFTLMAGGAWGSKPNATTDLSAGAFFETGTGSYSGYNHTVGMASVKGNGDGRYLGAGVLADVDFNNGFSMDAALRAGRIKTDLKTDFYYSGQQASFDKTTSTYYGAHIGGTYKWAITPEDHLNTYARYSWTYIDSDKVKVLGEEYHFKSASSHRIRVGTKYEKTSGAFMPYAGIAYEYEFDGREGGQVFGYGLKDIDLGGSTYIGEVGVSWLPTSRDNLRLNVAVEGFAGNREGVMASARLNYRF